MTNSSGITWVDGQVLTAAQMTQLDQSKANADGGVLTDATIAGGSVSADISGSNIGGEPVSQISTDAANAVAAATAAETAANEALAKTNPATDSTIGLVKPDTTSIEVAGDGTISAKFGTTTGSVADGGALASETAARIAAVASNAAAIAAETTRAEGVEATLATQAALAAEIARAEGAEAALAPLASPTFTGAPAAPTAAAGSDNTTLANTAYVDRAVSTEATARTAAIAVETERAEGVEATKAPLASPALTGTPTTPTAGPGTDNTQIASTAYADAAVAVEAAARVSGDEANAAAIVAEQTRAEGVEALKAPLASPALTGTPTAPTASALDASTKIATTAYADAAVSVEKTRAQSAEATISATASAAAATANAAQPKITASSGLLTGPQSLGAQPGVIASGTPGRIAIDTGTGWAAHPLSGDATLGADGTITVTGANGETFGALANLDAGNGTQIEAGTLQVVYGFGLNNAIQGGSQSASFALAAPTGSAGAPSWRRLSYVDIFGLGTAAQLTAGGANGAAVLDSSGNATGLNVLVGSTTQSLGTWLSGSVTPGGLFPPFGNYQGTGLPSITIPYTSELVINNTNGIGSNKALLFIAKTTSSVTQQSNSFALHVDTNVASTQAGQEWSGYFSISSASGASTRMVALATAATRNVGSTNKMWGFLNQSNDLTGLPSSGLGQHLGAEWDMSAYGLDNAGNAQTFGGTGIRKGFQFAFFGANVGGQVATEFSSGLWFNTDSFAYLDQAIGFNVGCSVANVLDTRGVAIPSAYSGQAVAALKMGAGQVIDLNGDATSVLVNAPQRYLTYSTTDAALEYWNGATSSKLFSVLDAGGANILGRPGTSVPAGYVGEVLSSIVPLGSALPATTGTGIAITSLTLTAGVWLLWGVVATAPATGTTTSSVTGGIQTGSGLAGTIPTTQTLDHRSALTANQAFAGNVTSAPVYITSSTTYYLNTVVSFAVSTMSVYGALYALRIA